MEAAMTVAAVRPVTIKLDDEMKARLQRLGEARQRTPHWLMREAITQYVEREERREVFRQDALKAWEAYRTTGLHLTGAEADAWLDQLEQGKDVDPPPCHG
jgi:predicted transcriptional regulator